MDRYTMIFSVNHCTPPAKETLQIEGFDRHYPSLHYLLGLYPCQADKEVAHGCAGVPNMLLGPLEFSVSMKAKKMWRI